MDANRLSWAIGFISAAGLAFQIVLMRVFSIGQWHHFAYMIISIAMLGFGVSGTLLALLRPRLRGRELCLLRVSAFLCALSLPLTYALSQHVPFETFELVQQRGQLLYLALLYVILAIPFFFISSCIALAFFLAPDAVAKLYGFNMLGSGLGAAGVVPALYVVSPGPMASLTAVLVFIGWLLLGVQRPQRWLWVGGMAFSITLVYAIGLPVRVSQYKPLSYAMQLPDAYIMAQRQSPMSLITAVSSAQLRETPGQVSYSYPITRENPLPEQVGLFFDAGGSSPVYRYVGTLEPFGFLDYITSALPYHLVERPEVLVIGAGGGTDVLSALVHDAAHVTAVEVDPSVFPLMEGPLAEFCGGLYDLPTVTPVHAEGRAWLEGSPERYDIIQIALLDAFSASAAGVHALNESYLYTVEGIALYLQRLKPGGVLAITRWLQTPPRDALKLLATTAEACERIGVARPGDHIALIRSWNTATLAVSERPLTAPQREAVRAFAEDRGFDLCWLSDMRPEEANRFTVLPEPYYAAFAADFFNTRGRDRLYRESLFYLRPPTDDRPYFFRFFKWRSLPVLWDKMGTEWIPFVEWGYLALVGTLLQAVAASVILILLPLATLRRRALRRKNLKWTVLYFGALGFAYMMLEIAFMQRLMLFLAYPVYAVAVVLTAFLVFSGLGSLAAHGLRHHSRHLVAGAVAGLLLFALINTLLLPWLGRAGAAWPDPVKILAAIAFLAPLAFTMGLPFPTILHRLSLGDPDLLPWAWGINGCTSVVGAILATLTAIHWGFRALVLVASVLYVVAAASSYAFTRSGGNQGAS
jgi:spermidine synthase